MEFRDDNWVNLYYLSALTEERTFEEVNSIWSLDHSEERRSNVESELERLANLRIVDKTGDEFKAKLKSQSFVDELKTYCQSHEILEDVENVVQHLKTLRLEGNKDLLLRTSQIKYFYNYQEKLPKEDPMKFFSDLLKIFEKESLPEKARLNEKQAQDLLDQAKERRKR